MYEPDIRGCLREGSNSDDLLPISSQKISRDLYLSEELSSTAPFAAVKVDVNIMILAINGFLHIWLLQNPAVYGKGIVIDHLKLRNRRVLIQIDSQLKLDSTKSRIPS